MHLETHYDPERGEDADRLVLSSQREEFYAENLFKVGHGVGSGTIGRDYSDPLQAPRREYPITFSSESTTTVFKGLFKIMDGPPAGYFGIKPHEAAKTYNELVNCAADIGNTVATNRFFKPDSPEIN